MEQQPRLQWMTSPRGEIDGGLTDYKLGTQGVTLPASQSH